MIAALHVLLACAAAVAPPQTSRRGVPPAPRGGAVPPVLAPTVAVDAGPDLEIELGEAASLAGLVTGLAPIHYWAGDGNNETENRMLIYHSDTGFEVFGPLLQKNNRAVIFGWPSDVIRIDGTIYGIETGQRYFYSLDETTAECTPIGRRLPYEWLTCLAWDPGHRVLYAVDGKLDQLMTIDLRSGSTRHIGGRLPYDEIKGMAFHERSGRIFAYDSKTDELFTIDPATAQTQPYLKLRLPRGAFFDELDVYQGEIYGVLAYNDADGVRMGQVQHIDLLTGERTDIGPVMVDVSAHSLMIESMPQRVKWSMLRGPGRARFAAPGEARTAVTFTEPGDYTLQLSVLGGRPLSDVIEVRVRPRDCNQNGIDDRRELELDPGLDQNRNGRPDDCECLPPPRIYCTFEPARARLKPDLEAHGDPKPPGEEFEIRVSGGSPFQSGFLFLDVDPREHPILLPPRSLTRPLRWIHLERLDAFGGGRVRVDIEPWMAGTSRHFRFLNISDAGSSRVGVRMSDILWVSFCL